MNPLDHIMGVDEAAERWGLAPGYIKNLCAAGRVKARKVGKTWILDKNQPNPRGGNQMKTFGELNVTNSTIIEWEGKELRTVQDPYIDGEIYKATALDSDGGEYVIVWEITNSETTDESEACDWDNPIKVTSI